MRRITVLALFLLAALTLPAADRELMELLETLDATCEWDPLREAGVILAGSDRIAFQVGTPFVLVNYAERLDIPAPRREGGRIVFAEEADRDGVRGSGAHEEGRAGGGAAHRGDRARSRARGEWTRAASARASWTGKDVPLCEKDIVLPARPDGRRAPAGRIPGEDRWCSRAPTTRRSRSRTAPRWRMRCRRRSATRSCTSSIHANANPPARRRTGFEVWYLPPTYRRTLLAPEDAGDDPDALEDPEQHARGGDLGGERGARARDPPGARRADRDAQPEPGPQGGGVGRGAQQPHAGRARRGRDTSRTPARRRCCRDPAYLQDIAEGLYNGIIAFIARFERAGSSGDR